jgi:hypothetical protein
MVIPTARDAASFRDNVRNLDTMLTENRQPKIIVETAGEDSLRARDVHVKTE